MVVVALDQAQRSINSRYPSLKLAQVRVNSTGVERSATGGKQPGHEEIGQGGSGGGKASPLAQHPGNGSRESISCFDGLYLDAFMPFGIGFQVLY